MEEFKDCLQQADNTLQKTYVTNLSGFFCAKTVRGVKLHKPYGFLYAELLKDD
jgi:hypothetical protein